VGFVFASPPKSGSNSRKLTLIYEPRVFGNIEHLLCERSLDASHFGRDERRDEGGADKQGRRRRGPPCRAPPALDLLLEDLQNRPVVAIGAVSLSQVVLPLFRAVSVVLEVQKLPGFEGRRRPTMPQRQRTEVLPLLASPYFHPPRTSQ